MKAKKRESLSFSMPESEHLNDSRDKIEVVKCPLNELMCKEHLSVVNKCYVESEQYRRNKEFQRSIETLKNAFYKTMELNELPCTKCAVLFRSTIKESLESIHSELEKMTTGFFGNKHYQSNFVMAEKVLREFENTILSNTFKLKESQELHIGNLPKKNVS